MYLYNIQVSKHVCKFWVANRLVSMLCYRDMYYNYLHYNTDCDGFSAAGSTVSPQSTLRCNACGHIYNSNMSSSLPSMSPPATPGFYVPPHSTGSNTAVHHAAALSGSSTPQHTSAAASHHHPSAASQVSAVCSWRWLLKLTVDYFLVLLPRLLIRWSCGAVL